LKKSNAIMIGFLRPNIEKYKTDELLHANYKLPFANILLDDFDLIFLTFVSLISLKLRISQHPPML